MSNLTLFQATELAQFHNFVDAETAEFDVVRFEASNITLIEKQRAVVAYVRNLELNNAMRIAGKQAAIDLVNAHFDADINRDSKQLDFYYGYLLQNMQKSGIIEIVAADNSFSAKIKSNPASTVIDDLSAIPAEFMRVKPAPPPEPDKNAIKEAIKAGNEVAGAHLESSQKLVIK